MRVVKQWNSCLKRVKSWPNYFLINLFITSQKATISIQSAWPFNHSLISSFIYFLTLLSKVVNSSLSCDITVSIFVSLLPAACCIFIKAVTDIKVQSKFMKLVFLYLHSALASIYLPQPQSISFYLANILSSFIIPFSSSAALIYFFISCRSSSLAR